MIDFVLPPDNRVGSNCGVTAVAVLAGISFETAWAYLGRSKPKTWKGWLWTKEVLAAFRKFGVRYRRVQLPSKPHLQTFAQLHADDPEVYFVVTGNHFCILHRGRLTDQQGTKPVAETSFAKARVKELYRVVPR